MNREQLKRRLRKIARKTGADFSVSTKQGKGSHETFTWNDRKATVPSGQLKTGTLKAILAQLGLDDADL